MGGGRPEDLFAVDVCVSRSGFESGEAERDTEVDAVADAGQWRVSG